MARTIAESDLTTAGWISVQKLWDDLTRQLEQLRWEPVEQALTEFELAGLTKVETLGPTAACH